MIRGVKERESKGIKEKIQKAIQEKKIRTKNIESERELFDREWRERKRKLIKVFERGNKGEEEKERCAEEKKEYMTLRKENGRVQWEMAKGSEKRQNDAYFLEMNRKK